MNSPRSLAEQAYAAGDDGTRSARAFTHRAIDQLSDGVHRLAANTDELAHRGAQAMREQAQHLREQARTAADHTIVHVRERPLQSVMVAAAFGAALGLLLAFFGKSRD